MIGGPPAFCGLGSKIASSSWKNFPEYDTGS
jgi:hypothetical protein